MTKLKPLQAVKTELADFAGERPIGRVNIVVGRAENLLGKFAQNINEAQQTNRGIRNYTYQNRFPLKSVTDFADFRDWVVKFIETRPGDFSLIWSDNRVQLLQTIRDKNGLREKDVVTDVDVLGCSVNYLLRFLGYCWGMQGENVCWDHSQIGMHPDVSVRMLRGLFELLAFSDRGPKAATIITAADEVLNFTGSAIRQKDAVLSWRDVKIHVVGKSYSDAYKPDAAVATYGFDKEGTITGGWPYGFFCWD